MDHRNLNGKGLMVSISEESRSISSSPQPGSLPMLHGNSHSSSMPSELGMLGGDDSPYLQEDSSGEPEPSQFGRAKKPKRKTAPRTSRACCECKCRFQQCRHIVGRRVQLTVVYTRSVNSHSPSAVPRAHPFNTASGMSKTKDEMRRS